MGYTTEYNLFRPYCRGAYDMQAYNTDKRQYAAKDNTTSYLKSFVTIVGLGALIGGAAVAYSRVLSADQELMGKLELSLKDNCPLTLKTADQILLPWNKNKALDEIFHYCPDQQKEAVSKMYGEGKRDIAYEKLIDSLVKQGKEEEGVTVLNTKIRSETRYHRIRDDLLYKAKNPDVRAPLARALPNGVEKDHVYQVITEKYVRDGKCDKALDFARELNVNDSGYAFDGMMLTNREKKIYRDRLVNKLENALQAQHDRLDAILAGCDSRKIRNLVREAKERSADIVEGEIEQISNMASPLSFSSEWNCEECYFD